MIFIRCSAEPYAMRGGVYCFSVYSYSYELSSAALLQRASSLKTLILHDERDTHTLMHTSAYLSLSVLIPPSNLPPPSLSSPFLLLFRRLQNNNNK